MDPCAPSGQTDIDRLIADSPRQNIHLGWMDLSEIEPSSKIIRIEETDHGKILLGLQHVGGSIYWLHSFCCPSEASVYDLSGALKTCLPSGDNKIYAISSHLWFSELLEKNSFVKCDEILQYESGDLSVPKVQTGYQIRPLTGEQIREAFACETVFPPLWRLGSREFVKAFQTSSLNIFIGINGDFAGYLLADPDEDNCHINRLAVPQEYQNSGAATALLSAMAEECRARNITHFSVNTNKNNTAAVNFYLRRNFSREGRTYPVYGRYIHIR